MFLLYSPSHVDVESSVLGSPILHLERVQKFRLVYNAEFDYFSILLYDLGLWLYFTITIYISGGDTIWMHNSSV